MMRNGSDNNQTYVSMSIQHHLLEVLEVRVVNEGPEVSPVWRWD